jgi:hypothetical protein
LFLALWLVLFSVQATDLVAAVVPDACVEETQGTSADPCKDACPRCLCCTRAALFISHLLTPLKTDTFTRIAPPEFTVSRSSGAPHDVFHVPKHPLA